jgi:hypothetical protein
MLTGDDGAVIFTVRRKMFNFCVEDLQMYHTVLELRLLRVVPVT